ncbi:aspartate 1-decarboxylase autocleavage activator PanM [Pantoea sp. FN060301]|uniref:aspartate 1-decarboxylase autocleavage activator PanM n=1 Tax=Pantoea sp. FN060301 TaxID=3420380 RepID=UPI003D181231
MKLTIIRLQQFSPQDRSDLAKIWPGSDLDALEKKLDEQHQLFAAKFNERLLAAVEVTLKGTHGDLDNFMVREVTRRRGVGSYLLEETLAQNSAITQWWIADMGSVDREAIAVFMQKAGFVAQPGGWISLQR